ncbi:GGDEF domain-containing protein [Noviherbaspirillum agri]
MIHGQIIQEESVAVLGFDPRSFIIISGALGILCTFIFFVLHRSFPKEIRGLSTWGLACLVMAAASLLFSLRGSIPLTFSSYLANVMLVSGISLMYCSLQAFSSLPVRKGNILLLIAAVAFALVWPTFIVDDYRMRVILIGTVNAGLFGACAVVIHRLQQKGFAEWFTEIVFLFTSVICFVRSMASVLQLDAADPILDVSPLQHLYLATFSFSIVALSLGFMLMVNRRLQRQLEYAAAYDDMTGACRRGTFFDALDRELLKSRRDGRPISVLMVDLDNFKSINDQLGHLVGDQVLADYVQKAQYVLRNYDLLGRYGGEEFIVLLPNTSQEEASGIAERLRAVAEQGVSGDSLIYTVSIGVATCEGGHVSAATLIAAADKALYVAKHSGKNRVEIADWPALPDGGHALSRAA